MRCKSAQVPCEWVLLPRKPRKRKNAPTSVDSLSTNRTANGSDISLDQYTNGEILVQRKRYHDILPRICSPSPGRALSTNEPITLPSSLNITPSDREYLSFFPYTTIVRMMGKSWRWATVRYIHSYVAPHSSVLMRVILSFSAAELNAARYHQQNGRPCPPGHADKVANFHYGHALQGFHSRLCSLQLPFLSQSDIDEIFSTFFMIISLELRFGAEKTAFGVHIRGAYAFLRSLINGSIPSAMSPGSSATFSQSSVSSPGLPSSCAAENSPLPWELLPPLSQQLLLFIIYVNLSLARLDSHAIHLWEEAGHEIPLETAWRALFHLGRQTHRLIWSTEYPVAELMDDISVYRPLEMLTECNIVKCRLIRIAHRQKQLPSPSMPVDDIRVSCSEIKRDLETLELVSFSCLSFFFFFFFFFWYPNI